MADVTTIEMKIGEPTTVNFNRMVRFEITLCDGSYIHGIIPANTGITVMNQGAFASVNTYYDGLPGLSLV